MKYPSYHIGYDLVKCNKLLKWIEKQTPVMTEAISLTRYESLQVREKEYDAHIQEIADSIDGKVVSSGEPKEQGDTKALGLRVVLFEGVGIGDGWHTTNATYRSKFGNKVPLVTTPSERIEGFNEAELRYVSYLLNAKDKVFENKTNSFGDLKKCCLELHEKGGLGIHSHEMLVALMGLNILPDKANKVVNAVEKDIKDKEYNDARMLGKKYVNHDSKKNKKKYADMIEELQSDGKTLAYVIAAGSRGAIQHLLMKVMDSHSSDIERLVVLVKHTSCARELDWDSNRTAERNMLRWVMDHAGVETQFETLDYIQPDTGTLDEEI